MEGRNIKNVLEIKDLVVEYRLRDSVVQAVNGLDLTVRQGQTVALVGETGAGKTTTALSVLGMVPSPPGVVVGGNIRLGDGNVQAMSRRQLEGIRGKQVSMIFQDPMTSLNPVITVENQIAEVIRRHRKGLSRKDVLAQSHEILELVGIPAERGREYPHQFSGGMKQRVGIAIALACEPVLLIADEPTTALDVTIQAQILELMRNLREKNDSSMLLITHDLGVVAEICDEVSVIYAGRIVEHGTLEDVFNNTRHPYTQGLFDSLPDMDDRSAKLKPIRGLMPDPSNLPPGCVFCPRCDYAMGICAEEKPAKTRRSDTHYVECHLYNSENIQLEGVLR